MNTVSDNGARGKWTPGPWSVYRPDSETAVYEGGDAMATIRGDGGGIYVATMPPRQGDLWTSTHEANARLISAAPDMAEALRAAHGPICALELWVHNNIVASSQYDPRIRREIDTLCGLLRAAEKLARAALAKAGAR